MPIDIHEKNGKLHVSIVDQKHTTQLNILLQSLLNSQLIRAENAWQISWHDFLQLKEKMERMGLTQGRSATNEAIDWIKNQEAQDAEIDHIKAGKQNDLITDVANLLKTTLYSDQLTGVRFLTTRTKAVLADEMGIGKTLQLLAAFALLRKQQKHKYALVVCPNSVKQGWVKEVAKHTNLTVTALGNGSVELAQNFAEYKKNRTNVLVIHFDAFVSHKTKNNKRRLPYSTLVEDMLKIPWDTVIIDEAHQVKNLEVKRSQAVLHFRKQVKSTKKTEPHIYLATGTPVSESPLDAWGVFNYLAPELVPKTWSKFENYFAVKANRTFGSIRVSETVGFKNLAELKSLLHRLMIRRLKTDIAGMPEKVVSIRYVQMGGEQKKLYDDIKKDVYKVTVADKDDKLSIAFAMTKCIRLRQALNHPSLVGMPGTSAKHAELDLILEEVLADPMAKILIWTEWRSSVDLLYERYHKKYGAIKLVGGTSQAEMASLSKNWDTMPERVAIAIPAFGGTGVDFLQRCRTAVYTKQPYSTIMMRQSADRIHRRTGEIKTEIDKIKASPANLIFLQVEKSIDELVYKALTRKGDLVDAMLITDETLLKLGREELLEYLR